MQLVLRGLLMTLRLSASVAPMVIIIGDGTPSVPMSPSGI